MSKHTEAASPHAAHVKAYAELKAHQAPSGGEGQLAGWKELDSLIQELFSEPSCGWSDDQREYWNGRYAANSAALARQPQESQKQGERELYDHTKEFKNTAADFSQATEGASE